METWKPVVGWEDRHEVSDQGRVRRLSGLVLRPSLNRDGYPRLRLKRDDVDRSVLVHRLVAAAFLGPCPAGKEVNHKDGNKANSALMNLEYVTPSENKLHSYRVLGRKAAPNYGSANGYSKLKEEQVLEIVRRYRGGENGKALAAHFGVTQPLVSMIVLGKKWSWLTGIVRSDLQKRKSLLPSQPE